MSNYRINQSRLAKNAFTGWTWNFLLQITTIGLSGTIFVISSWFLEPQQFGIVAFSAAIVALVSSVMPIAFGQALIQRENIEERHLQSVFWLCIGFAALAYFILLVTTPIISHFQQMPSLFPIISVLGSKLVFDGLNTVPNAILQRKLSFKTLAIRSIAANIIAAATCVTLIYFGAPLWGLVLSQAIGPLVSTLVLFAVTRWRPQGLIDGNSLRELSGFGIYVFGGQILNSARIDQLILGATLGPVGLGLYYFAHRLYTLCIDVTGGAFVSVSNAVFSAIQGDIAKRKAAFELASFASTCIGFPVFAGVLVTAPTAVPLLFGAQWNDAVIMVQALCVIGFMATLGVIQGSMITYLGHASWWFRYQLCVQVSGWILIVVMAPYGAAAVVVALSLRTVVLWPASVWKASKVLEISTYNYALAFWAPATASIVMAGVVMGASYLTNILDPWVLLLTKVTLGATVYCALIFVFERVRIIQAISLLRNQQGNI